MAQGAPPLQHLLGGTPTNFKGAGGVAWPRLVGPAGFGWLRGGWRAGCALQHTTRGKVKQRGAGRPPLGEPARAKAVGRCFAVPLLCAERSALPGGPAAAFARVVGGLARAAGMTGKARSGSRKHPA